MSEQTTWHERAPRPDLLWVGRYKVFEVQGSRYKRRPIYKSGRYDNTSHPDFYFPAFTGISREEMHQRKRAFYELTDKIMMDVDWSDDGESDNEETQEALFPIGLPLEHGADDDASVCGLAGPVFDQSVYSDDSDDSDDNDEEYHYERWDISTTVTHTILASSKADVPSITLTEEHRDWSPVRKYPQNPSSYDVPWGCQDAGSIDDASVWYEAKRHCFRKGMTAFVPWGIQIDDDDDIAEFGYNWLLFAEEQVVPAQFKPDHSKVRSVELQNSVNYHRLLTSALLQSASSTSSSQVMSPSTSTTSSASSSALTRGSTFTSATSVDSPGCHSSRAPPSAALVTMGLTLPGISIGQTPFAEADGEIWRASGGKKWIKRGLKKALVQDSLAKEAKESRDQRYNFWTMGLYNLIAHRRV